MSSSMTGSQGMRGPAGSATGQKNIAGHKVKQIQNYTPEQMDLFRQMFEHVSPDSYTSRLARGDEELFEEMEAPAHRQFQELTGQNASRFSGMGMGARRGSGFQNYQTQATQDFAMNLQAQRQELMRQAIQDLRGMSSDLLDKRPFENVLVPEKQSGWQQLVSGALPIVGAGVGAAAGGFAGGPAGAWKGAELGLGAGSAASRALY